jgi:hypothetical protein
MTKRFDPNSTAPVDGEEMTAFLRFSVQDEAECNTSRRALIMDGSLS